MTGTVQIAELSGSESTAHFRMGAETWVSLSPGVHPCRVGQDHVFYMDPAHCFFFAPDGALAARGGAAWPRSRSTGSATATRPVRRGKSTLLNIISWLLQPSEGRILFDGKDVTELPPDRRNIAQAFQFPVICDTMTVRDNLAFPLRNRGVDETRVKARVEEIAAMLENIPLAVWILEGFALKGGPSDTRGLRWRRSRGRRWR